MNIVIQPSADNGGSSIIIYELWVDQGNDYTSTFTQVTGYTGKTLSYSIATLDGLTRGYLYRFVTRSLNTIGYSDFSDFGYIAYGDVPPAPNAPTMVSSTQTSLTVAWTTPPPSDLPIIGYILSMDDGINGNFV